MADQHPAVDFVLFLVRSLVEHQDAVKAEATGPENKVSIELSVDPTDLPSLIGEDSLIAEALRISLDAYAYKHRIRARLLIAGEQPAS